MRGFALIAMLTTDLSASRRLIARRIFCLEDQRRFADFSGDFNPIHLDALAARRTQMGAVVVHGVHQALWALEELPQILPSRVRISQLRVRFPQVLFLEESATLSLLQQDEDMLRLCIKTKGVVTANIVVQLEYGKADVDATASDGCGEIITPAVCRNLTFEEMKGLSGDLPIWNHVLDARLLFPAATGLIGATRVNAIAALSRLVGMVCPGLNSIFSSIDIRLNKINDQHRLRFSVSSTDRRFSFVRQSVHGGGIEGEVEGFMRTPPAAQPSITEIAELVDANEFAGSVALVVGASRGLGEFVAKAIGAGGGQVMATYCVGRDECQQIADEIRSVGGRCNLLAYDARRLPAEQLETLPVLPKSLYYFATPKIFGRPGELFDAGRFSEFVEIYVTGFYALCSHLQRLGVTQLAVFYPSSIAVESSPADMTAYAMAKAAGEVLCDSITGMWPELRVVKHRLPRMLTDQTATLASVESASVENVMLPIVREVERSV